jgi:hypothetical protein
LKQTTSLWRAYEKADFVSTNEDSADDAEATAISI